MYYTIMKTHMCDIILVGDEDGLTNLHLNTLKGKRSFEIDKKWTHNEEHFSDVIEQLRAYFRGELNTFSLKLNPKGSDYQKKVWNELRSIKFNEILSYKSVAIRLGNPKASRAVGMANSKNPIPIIIPCHRVVASNGKLTGFAHGLEIKEKLINFEKMSDVFNKLADYYGDIKCLPVADEFIIVDRLEKPSFIIDTCTMQMFKRLGFSVPNDYDDFRLMIEDAMEIDAELYSRYHEFILEHSKYYCMKIPSCGGCPVYDLCDRNIQLI
ncbi:MAG: methylated-DNA--[protein]-cysteine S-methyltransferase [Acidaminobacteraceae bacterium]